ncbi:hypothetical protein PE066_08690 [Ramlibacter tataouinensis]|uniref:hypothetical protein n=1 Tax=Ramlibacter tataouinensis TaxID=94132 RepID=UPI0022F3DA5B|nr:hypothetical protein [Ramlibacter tataouinensis]WBY03591.1 hypothetical protein PE066_08690 [Ramlibacter tataouinensis]
MLQLQVRQHVDARRRLRTYQRPMALDQGVGPAIHAFSRNCGFELLVQGEAANVSAAQNAFDLECESSHLMLKAITAAVNRCRTAFIGNWKNAFPFHQFGPAPYWPHIFLTPFSPTPFAPRANTRRGASSLINRQKCFVI